MLNFQEVLVAFVLILWIFCCKRKKLWDLAAKIPGNDGLPIIGILAKFIGVKAEDLYSSGLDLVNLYSSSFKVWIGPFLVFVVRDPSEVKILLNSDECFEKPKMLYKSYFSYGMLSMGGNTYKFHRKNFLSLFYPKNLQQYNSKINLKVNNFLKTFDNKLKPMEMEMSEHALEFSLDTFLFTIFEMEVSEATLKKFLHDAENFFTLSSERLYKWWLMIDCIHKLTANYHTMTKHRNGIYEFIDMLIASREQEFQNQLPKVPEKSENSQNFLDRIYKIRHTMTYEETREEIFTFITAGFDTTGKIIPAVLLLLAMNPEIQEKLFAELYDVMKSENDEVAEESLKNMTYLDMVIKEAGRLIPAVLMFARNVNNDIELPKYTLPKGSIATFMSLEIHTDEKQWGSDAKQFKPERFSSENFRKIDPNAYLLYSKGPRSCPGMTFALLLMKIFLSKFLLKYRVTTSLKYEELKFQMTLTTMVQQGFMVKVEKR